MDKRFGQVDDRFDELKRHFDVVAEAFKTQFNNLFDRTQSKTSTIGARLDALELTCTAGAPTKPRRSLLRKRTQEG